MFKKGGEATCERKSRKRNFKKVGMPPRKRNCLILFQINMEFKNFHTIICCYYLFKMYNILLIR